MKTGPGKSTFMESSIRQTTIHCNSSTSNVVDEDEDLKDLFIEMTKGKQQPSKQSAYRPK
jgi:hypothetical protein